MLEMLFSLKICKLAQIYFWRLETLPPYLPPASGIRIHPSASSGWPVIYLQAPA